MPVLSMPVVVAGAALLFYLIVSYLVKWQKVNKFKKAHGCKDPLPMPRWDRIFGSDLAINAIRAQLSNRSLDYIKDLHIAVGPTAHGNVMGINLFATVDPENVKAILATQFNDFELGYTRRNALSPLLGNGIFTADGKFWEHSRALVRPNFTRHQVADLDAFEHHISNLIALIPRDGSTVDLQKLFFNMTIDSSTEFLFGKSVGSLKGQGGNFAEAFNYSQDICAIRFKLGDFMFLHYDSKYKKACKEVHQFADFYVREALELRKKGIDKKEKEGDERYIFLHELALQTSDPVELRDQLLNILLAGRDTTAGLLSNLWLELSKRPEIVAQLQAEVATLGDTRPTFEQIKDLKFLKFVMNEGKFGISWLFIFVYLPQ
jgi:cytochrome P450